MKTAKTTKTKKNTGKRTLGQAIIAGLQEALAFERGELPEVEVRRVALSARQASVDPAPVYDKVRVTHLRERLALSQAVFAQALNVKPATVRSWEQGQRVPDGAAARLLQIVEERPQLLAAKVVVRPPRVAGPEARQAAKRVPMVKHTKLATKLATKLVTHSSQRPALGGRMRGRPTK